MGAALRSKLLAWGALALLGLPFPALAQDTFPVGIIQYNAKGGQPGQGGWKAGTPAIAAQIAMLAGEIADPKLPAPVDFITLEQATFPLVSSELAGDKTNPQPNWRTVRGGCIGDNPNGTHYVEGTQIGYSAAWRLVPNAGPTMKNPLSDTFNSSFDPAESHCFSPGRSYNIAYFEKVADAAVKVLVIVVHPPHCADQNLQDLQDCVDDDFTEFQNFPDDLLSVTGAKSLADLQDVNTLIAGDTNEFGDFGVKGECPPFAGDGKGYGMAFPQFGALTVTPFVEPCAHPGQEVNGTCCNDSGWNHHFDRVVANRQLKGAPAAFPAAHIVDTAAYPLFEKPGRGKEHKAIYAVVAFPK